MKYEYVTVPLLTHATKQILDTWGSEGWELVQVVPAPGGGDQLVAYMTVSYTHLRAHETGSWQRKPKCGKLFFNTHAITRFIYATS